MRATFRSKVDEKGIEDSVKFLMAVQISRS